MCCLTGSHIVSHIGLWRPINGGEPQDVDPEVLEIIELRVDAIEVPDAIAVRVEERDRVDLVHDRFFPPSATVRDFSHDACIHKGNTGELSRMGFGFRRLATDP